MKKPVVMLVAGLGLLVGRWARAQQVPAAHHRAGRCCCPRDTTTLTERSNSVVGLFGPALLLDQGGLARGGGFAELGAAVAPRLSVTGHLLMTANRASASSLGTEATAPAYSLLALTGRARWQLFNGRRWRVEGLAGAGLGAVWVVDRDQLVYQHTKSGGHYVPATVAFRVHPLAEAGLSTSWKVNRAFWLSSQLTYSRPVLGSSLGAPAQFAYWSATVAATIPWGYLGRKPHARPPGS